MSLGYTGHGRYKEEKDGCLIYEYSGENWNAPYNSGDCLLYDGLISIEKSAFNRFKDIKFDYLALRIIIHIFNDYNETGEIPQKVAFIQ